jgi:hypothetical protein
VTNLFPKQKQSLKRFGRADEGQALVLTALALVVLMMMAGLGVDVGYLRYQKQQMQKAADAGAIAGASALLYGGSWQAAGQNDAAANGFANGGGQNGTISVRVDTPWEGPFAGKAGYVEASVSQPQPTFFMKFGSLDPVPVRSWAVASARVAGQGCIIVLDPQDQSTYMAAGGAVVSANCGIYVDSTNANAFDQNGTGCTHASFIAISGGIKSDSCSTPLNPSTYVAPPAADPLAGVAPPQFPPVPPAKNCTYQTSGQTVFGPPPGSTSVTYCGGISLNSGGPFTFNPGTYILYGGGLTINAQASVSGTGVTFYNTGTKSGTYGFAPITITGGGIVTLSAPTSGPLAGMLFFEDRDPLKHGQITNTITGQSGSTFTGALYFPTTSLSYAGGTAVGGYTVVVAWQVKFVGNSTFSNDYSSLTGGPLIAGVALVE